MIYPNLDGWDGGIIPAIPMKKPAKKRVVKKAVSIEEVKPTEPKNRSFSWTGIGWGQVQAKDNSGIQFLRGTWGAHGGCCGVRTFIGQWYATGPINSLPEDEFQCLMDTVFAEFDKQLNASGCIQLENIRYYDTQKEKRYTKHLIPERVVNEYKRRGFIVSEWFYNYAHRPEENLVQILTYIPKANKEVVSE